MLNYVVTMFLPLRSDTTCVFCGGSIGLFWRAFPIDKTCSKVCLWEGIFWFLDSSRTLAVLLSFVLTPGLVLEAIDFLGESDCCFLSVKGLGFRTSLSLLKRWERNETQSAAFSEPSNLDSMYRGWVSRLVNWRSWSLWDNFWSSLEFKRLFWLES